MNNYELGANHTCQMSMSFKSLPCHIGKLVDPIVVSVGLSTYLVQIGKIQMAVTTKLRTAMEVVVVQIMVS